MIKPKFEKLVVSNLSVEFSGSLTTAKTDRPKKAVDDISFCLQQGEHLGLIGESGSGKTVTALSLLGLERGRPGIVAGTIEYNDRQLLPDWSSLFPGKSSHQIGNEKRKHWRKWRRTLAKRLHAPGQWPIQGAQIGIVFQNPLEMLDPLFSIGQQMLEAIALSKQATDRQQLAVSWLEKVYIDQPDKVANLYPHQLSGGMCQRVVIALALASKPNLLIVDEPTTALDVTTGSKILLLLRDLCQQEGLTLLVISHNAALIRELTEKVVVIQRGQIIETLKFEMTGVRKVLKSEHPYTRELTKSVS
jgi:ABC-type dipeptide/oligopeptide/nickel transport system ATPase component